MTGPRHQISWRREEIVLACDLVRQNGWWELRSSDRRVVELSELLQLPWAHPLDGRPENFRNANSVSRKTSDIFTQLPHYAGKATKGNQLDGVVLADFLADPDGMAEQAATLRRSIRTGEPIALSVPPRRTRRTGPRDVETPQTPTSFAARTSTSTPPPEPVDPLSAEWVLAGRVLASDTYRHQSARAGRHALRADVVHVTLATLLARGGRASKTTLAAATGLPEVSFDSTVAALRRLTNIEGYDVVALDPDDVTIRLDAALLRDQFALG